MCKTRPGIRCSDHSAKKLLSYYERKQKLEDQLKVLAGKEATAEGSTEVSSVVFEREALERKLSRLNQVIEFEELDYDATPKGQESLASRIVEAAEDEKPLLEADLEVAKKRRTWQLLAGRRFRKLDKDETVEGQQEAVRLAQLEKDVALAKAAEQRKKMKQYESKRRQLPAKPSLPAHKVAFNRIQKGLRIAKKMYSLYMLVAFDMDGFLSRKAHSITMSLISKSAVAAATAGSNFKAPKPLKLEDFVESVELADDGETVLYTKYDTESILRRLNEPSNRR